MRQSGIYHRFDLVTCRSLLVVFNPIPQSAFECTLKNTLHRAVPRRAIVANPLLIHHMFLSQYSRGMQGYFKHIEEDLDKIVRIKAMYMLLLTVLLVAPSHYFLHRRTPYIQHTGTCQEFAISKVDCSLSCQRYRTTK